MRTYNINGRQVSYGSFEELQEVCVTIRKIMLDYIKGDIDEKQFFRAYCEFELHLLEHNYAKDIEYDLPDYESFLNRGKKEIKTEEILERVTHLINPNLDNTVKKLKANELDYFINHLAHDLMKSLKDWEFKTKE